jgi:hypothetical protein
LVRPTTATCRGPSPVFSCAQCLSKLDTASKPHASSEGSFLFPFPFVGSCATGDGRKDEAARERSVGCSKRKCAAHAAVGSRAHASTVDVSAMTTSKRKPKGREEFCVPNAPILLSTRSSFCPSFDATRASNARLRYESGSRASRTSITTSALSSTAARCGRFGLRSSGAPFVSVVVAGAEPDGPFVAGAALVVDLDELFVDPASVATPLKPSSSSSASSLSWP